MSELALKLIAKNKKTHSPFLDLGNCDLTEIPEEIGDLVWLEELSFATTWWEWNGSKWSSRQTQNTGKYNSITCLPTCFSKLKSLKKIISQIKVVKFL